MWQTITSTSVLMRLSRLAGTGNFGSSSLSPFLSIVLILPSQAVSFQIFLYAFFPDFPWSTLLTFPCYFKIHNLTYLWISTHYTTADSFVISSIFTTTPTLSRRTSVETLSTSLTQYIILIIQSCSTTRNLTSSATVSFHVSYQYSKTGLTQLW